MTPSEFQDLLQRSLAGELAEEEALRLYQELLSSPAALDEFLATRQMDHDLKRLLAQGAQDDAFLRGLLNSRSTARQDPEAFIRAVTRAHSRSGRRRTTRRAAPGKRRSWGVPALVVLAAGLLMGVSLTRILLSSRSPSGGTPEKKRATEPSPTAGRNPAEEDAREAIPPPLRFPERPTKVARPPEKRVEAIPPELEKKLADEEAVLPRNEGEKEKTTPEPPRPAPKPVPRPTVAAYASLGKIKGDVYVFAGSPARKSPAIEGQALAPGQGVLTEGPQSAAFVARYDSTRLSLGPDTEIRLGQARPEIALFQGKLDVEAGPREPGQEVFLTTPQADVRVAECRFTLTCTPGLTSLEVRQGAAKFTNAADGKSTEIRAGQHAIAQDPPGVDRRRVDEAIRKGVAYLRNAPSKGIEVFQIDHCDELILLALLAAGVSDTDPLIEKYLKNILSAPLGRTYLVSLQAMVLEELDRVKYQDRIAECAQFLLDNQCASGQWTYGGEPSKVLVVSETRRDVATPAIAAPSKDAATDLFGRRAKPAVVRLLKLRKTRDGISQGDNSNAQYAALGLRASSDAGIAVPVETVQRAADWWRKVQYPDPAGRGVASTEGGPARGWCYNDGKNPVNGGPCCVGAYASMTAGAVSSLMIYDHLLGTDWKKDVSVRMGLNWMTTYFTVVRNLGMDQAFHSVNGGTTPPETYHYYGLYALERVGVFSSQEKLGRHAWFAEGAKFILNKQRGDGSWTDGTLSSDPTWDTCFAILFLRRATRPLEDVPSVDRILPKSGTPK
jgi:hypothetical protein